MLTPMCRARVHIWKSRIINWAFEWFYSCVFDDVHQVADKPRNHFHNTIWSFDSSLYAAMNIIIIIVRTIACIRCKYIVSLSDYMNVFTRLQYYGMLRIWSLYRIFRICNVFVLLIWMWRFQLMLGSQSILARKSHICTVSFQHVQFRGYTVISRKCDILAASSNFPPNIILIINLYRPS
jgi:hypothetical protein